MRSIRPPHLPNLASGDASSSARTFPTEYQDGVRRTLTYNSNRNRLNRRFHRITILNSERHEVRWLN